MVENRAWKKAFGAGFLAIQLLSLDFRAFVQENERKRECERDIQRDRERGGEGRGG